MVIVTLATTRTLHIGRVITNSFVESTIQNFTNISKMTRRRYRTIIPATTRKFKRSEDKSRNLHEVQNTQSPQDLPSSKPPRSNSTPVHVRNMEDFERAVMAFMQEPLVSLAKPIQSTRRFPLKYVQEKQTESVRDRISNPDLDDRMNIVPNDVSPIQDQTVPNTDFISEEVFRRTHDFLETGKKITSEFFGRNYDKKDQATIFRPRPFLDSTPQENVPKISD